MTTFLFNNRALPFASTTEDAKTLWLVSQDEVESGNLPEDTQNWAKSAGFDGSDGSFLLIPAEDGSLKGALFGLGTTEKSTPFTSGKLSKLLPEGDWAIAGGADDESKFLLGFGLGTYKFENYLPDQKTLPKIAITTASQEKIERQLAGSYMARDLINIPTNDMGPDELEAAFSALGEHYDAKVSVIKGEELLEQNFPLIHTVGRASVSTPRLLEMNWGDPSAPKISLVGKGVCFDTGGLDIKPASAMGLMKKDMGGAANILGLALMIMDAKLPVNLQVLIPAVENSISSNAFRPGDIYKARNGLTVQIDNTDAEGRLVLADALVYACEAKPELVIDMATLTGAARVALGPDLPPFYTDDDTLASDIGKASEEVHDPLWRMPLYKGYEGDVKTRISDLTNAPSGGFAGSITAALFLKRFISPDIPWVHLDIYGWNPKDRPYSPVGGEAQAIRALYQVLSQRYKA